MKADTLLLRQISPSFIQAGRVSSQAFSPFPKDNDMLSVDNADKITAEKAYHRFISSPNCKSAGVMAVSVDECNVENLNIIEDGIPYPEHCSIDFSSVESKGQKKVKATQLRNKAEQRGWLFTLESY